MLSEKFQYLLSLYGPPTQPAFLPSETLAAYRGKLPNSLLDFWQEYGLGLWADGNFQFCNPADFSSVLALQFGADPQLSHKDCHVYGYFAFGKLLIWSERYSYFTISLPDLIGASDNNLTEDPDEVPDIDIAIPLGYLTTKDAPFFDINDKPLFERARKKLGALNRGECYGFFPALALGGSRTLEDLRRVPALEHFTILAQLGQPKLYDFGARPIRIIRTLG